MAREKQHTGNVDLFTIASDMLDEMQKLPVWQREIFEREIRAFIEMEKSLREVPRYEISKLTA